MRQTTRSCAYSFRKTIFATAPRGWALTRFPRSFENLTVLSEKDRRSLEVAAAFPWFWRKDRQSLPTFVSFVYVSMGGISGKYSVELKTPRRRGQHLRRWNQRQSERFYQTSAESLEVAFTLRSFLRKKKATRVILCFSVQNDQGKKVWDNRIWTGLVLAWFSIPDIALLAIDQKITWGTSWKATVLKSKSTNAGPKGKHFLFESCRSQMKSDTTFRSCTMAVTLETIQCWKMTPHIANFQSITNHYRQDSLF